jgi:dephospho-CoA kinase
MLRVGLTGGIACGKSAVAKMLADKGWPVLAADPLGHKLLEPGQAAYDEVVREFGAEILGEGGKVDRGKLGSIVFADPARRAKLNWILHPKILETIRRWFEDLDRPGGPEFAVMEAALIFEAAANRGLDRVVVCWCSAEQQLERLQARGLTLEQAQRRVAAQMPMDEKRRLADDVIDCSGTMEETERQVDELIEKLKRAPAKERKIS